MMDGFSEKLFASSCFTKNHNGHIKLRDSLGARDHSLHFFAAMNNLVECRGSTFVEYTSNDLSLHSCSLPRQIIGSDVEREINGLYAFLL